MKKLLVASLITVLVGLGLFTAGCSSPGQAIKNNAKKEAENVPANYSLMKGRSYGSERKSLSDSAKHLVFKPRLPSNTLGNKIVAFYTSEESLPLSERRFYALYEGELLFTQGPIIKAPGSLRAPGLKEVHDEYFYVDESVNDVEAIAHDPIDIKTENFRAEGGSVVIWQTDNFKYGVLHPSLSYKELLKVAESVPIE